MCHILGVSAANCRRCNAAALRGFDSSSNNNNPPLCVTLTACLCRSVCCFLVFFFVFFLAVTGTGEDPKRTKSPQSCSRPATVTHSPFAAATLGCGPVTYKRDESCKTKIQPTCLFFLLYSNFFYLLLPRRGWYFIHLHFRTVLSHF